VSIEIRRIRTAQLEGSRITFVIGGGVPDNTELIENVRSTSGDNPNDYTVRLRARDDSTESIVLQFSPQNGGELRLNSQSKVVWKRNMAGTTPGARTPGGTQVETSRKNVPQQDGPAVDRIYGEHVTIYKIDCVRVKNCHSY
jgi:predicted Rdx family selenoprotein